jgi:hypothetical protein
MDDAGHRRWLLLLLHIPTRPDYLRVKTGRRLQKLGALAVKNGVFVLPDTAEAREDFAWLAREMVEAGGEGTVASAELVEGFDDDTLVERFRTARDGEVVPLLDEARELMARVEAGHAESAGPDLERLRRRVDEVAKLDWFGSHMTLEAQRICAEIAEHLSPKSRGEPGVDWTGRTWVTRQAVRVDRMACAWLIRRFIDPTATLKFVSPQGYVPQPGELRFDMFDAEFGHEGDQCSFETIVRRLALADAALTALAEIVHDVDCKDGKFSRPEAIGLALAVDGIAATTSDDAERVARASVLLDAWHAALCRRGTTTGTTQAAPEPVDGSA